MSMKQDGFTAEEIRKTQLQELVGRAEAIRLLKDGNGWKKPAPCKHIYGYSYDGMDFCEYEELPDYLTKYDKKFNYCPICGEKL
ncbi:MAG: hypothetical protein HOD11_14435 [Candidatus Marinimicrobia bacterium]|nr:hypothetical protein [Candidatus Neomarinimicrobiota bacterium]